MKKICLRNIGGITIIDFINMKIDAARAVLLKFLKSLAQLDSGKINVVDMTPLGLVEIT